MNFFSGQIIYCQEIIHEGFDKGLTAPPGWIITAGDIYKSYANSGIDTPSLKLGATGQYIETCEFANANEVSFFIKGNLLDTLSSLIIFYRGKELWHKLDSITNISNTKKTIVLPLPDSVQKLKFVYFKSAGNLAFDDLIVKKIQNDTLPPVFNKIPELISPSDTSVIFSVSINKPGYVYCIISQGFCPFPADSVFLNFSLYDPKCLKFAAKYDMLNSTDTFIYINGLKPGAKYNSYWLVSSDSNVISSSGAKTSCEFSLPKIFHDLFFSEIIKGTGNNKAIEIFNPTGDTISLFNYRIVSSTNGKGWNTTFYKFLSGASMIPEDVFVILKANADPAVVDFSVADDSTNSSVLGFTGNDARGIQKLDVSSNTWKFVDIFGDPNSSVNFTVAGVTGAASNHTLIRKSFVRHGNSNWIISAGTDTVDSEWKICTQNDFSNLGKHTMFQDSLLFFNTVYFQCQEKPALIDSLKQIITLTVHSESDISDLSLKFSLSNGITINPDPSIFSDFGSPVKFVLSDAMHSFSTEWTVITVIDEAPGIIDIFYNNYPPSINITFNEPVFIKNTLAIGDEIPYVKIYANGNYKNILPFVKVFENDNKVLKLLLEAGLSPDTMYTVLIDSVRDLFYNKMPVYEWSFKTTDTKILKNGCTDCELKVWPNPSSGMLNVKLPPDFNPSNTIFELIGTDGKYFVPFIKEKEHEIQVLLTNVKSGIYVFNIKNGAKVLSSLVYVK